MWHGMTIALKGCKVPRIGDIWVEKHQFLSTHHRQWLRDLQCRIIIMPKSSKSIAVFVFSFNSSLPLVCLIFVVFLCVCVCVFLSKCQNGWHEQNRSNYMVKGSKCLQLWNYSSLLENIQSISKEFSSPKIVSIVLIFSMDWKSFKSINMIESYL